MLIFWWCISGILWKIFWKNNILQEIPCFLKKESQNDFFLIFKKITTIAYNMKGCLRFSNYIFWILPNFTKYTYWWSSLEQHHNLFTKSIMDLRCTNHISLFKTEVAYLCTKQGSLFYFVWHVEISQTMALRAVLLVFFGKLGCIDFDWYGFELWCESYWLLNHFLNEN